MWCTQRPKKGLVRFSLKNPPPRTHLPHHLVIPIAARIRIIQSHSQLPDVTNKAYWIEPRT